MVELVITLSVGLILTAVSVPIMKDTLEGYRLRNAVGSVTGAIQATRYRAISNGYPFQIAISKANSNFQISSDQNYTGTFANVGAATPFGTAFKLGQDTTLRFSPSGAIQPSGATAACPAGTPAGSICMTMSYNGKAETIAVSGYGKITVTP
jgi:Tfp pilus assembly protein FimT